MTDKFNYAIGSRWHEGDENSSVGLYSFGCNHWYGDKVAATETLEFIKGRDRNSGKVYRIYKIVEVIE